MDKGIRPAMTAKFNELLPKRASGELTNTKFRAEVMGYGQKEFGISVASAATHYNHSFKEARKAAETNPELKKMLEGLGRPEDKKGGRKKKEKPAANAGTATAIQANPAAASGTEGAANEAQGLQTTESTGKPATDGEAKAEGGEAAPKLEAPEGGTQETAPAEGAQAQEQSAAETQVVALPIEEQPVWGVKKAGMLGGKTIAEGLTKAKAQELIDRAAHAKKGKMELVAPQMEPQ